MQAQSPAVVFSMSPRYSRPWEESRVGSRLWAHRDNHAWRMSLALVRRHPYFQVNGGLLISFCSVQDCSFNTFNLSEPACRLAVIRTISLTWCSTEYVGCYKDSDPRDLPQRLHDREVTVSSCVKNCKDLFYRYAGIQFSYLCFCGNKRGRYGQLPEWKCSSECASKKDEHCGGYWSNSIYKTGAVGKLNSIFFCVPNNR